MVKHTSTTKKRQHNKTRNKRDAHRAVTKTASARQFSKLNNFTGVYSNTKPYQSKKYTKQRRKHQFKKG